jgi:sulfate/thiosulfate transport system permease protein
VAEVRLTFPSSPSSPSTPSSASTQGRSPSKPRSTSLSKLRRFLANVAGPSLSVTYLSLLVVLPIAAILSTAFAGGWGSFWAAVSQPEAVAALKLTLLCSLGVALFNSVAGLLIAWVLVRDEFRGKRIVSAIIDLPFALPTIVAGLTLLSLYGPNSPFGINVANRSIGILVALAFVTLPFSVRSVQPVLAEFDRETEEAAASLGASSSVILRRVILPSLAPAMLAGAGLAFARAVGEFGSVVLISGNLPFKTEVASSWIYSLSQSDSLGAAASVSVVLILIALGVLLGIGVLRRRFGITEAI